jgi:ADP-ribosylglycohydrolase
MIGAIIGDIVGSVYEYHNIKTKDFPLFRGDCYFTDDSVMTIAVAEALTNGGKPDDFINSMKALGWLYPGAGYGPRFNKWVLSDDREPYNSFGNGSAMRVSPVGWYFDNLGEVERFAEISAQVTHNHPEGIKGAKSVAGVIFLLRNGAGKAEIKKYVEEKYGYDLNRTLDEIRPAYKYDITCQGTVPEAIIAFIESTDFEDAVRNAVSIGGDSDTVAAITGSIAEAAYGIPKEIADRALSYLDASLRKFVTNFVNIKRKEMKIIEKSEINEIVDMTISFDEDEDYGLDDSRCKIYVNGKLKEDTFEWKTTKGIDSRREFK